MRFLILTMADQSSMGLKSSIDKLEKQVKSLTKKVDNLATKKSNHDLGAKLEGVIHTNNLKKKAGWCPAAFAMMIFGVLAW